MDETEYRIEVCGTFYFSVKAADKDTAEALAATQLYNVLGKLDEAYFPDEDEGGIGVTRVDEI